MFSGSLGAGLTLYPPVKFVLSYNKGYSRCRFIFNNRCIDELGLLKTIDAIVGEGKLNFAIEGLSVGDLGLGYGLSSAIAIAYSYAKLISLSPKHSIRLAKAGIIAHIAEVLNLTGLGDVIAEVYGGGLVIRLRPGPPTIGIIDSIPLSNVHVLVCELRGILKPTPQMLSESLNKQIKFGLIAYKNFIKNPCVESFLDEAYKFSKEVGFLTNDLDKKVRALLTPYLKSGCILGYYVKKSLLLVVVECRCVNEVKTVLSNFCKPKLLTPTQLGTLVLGRLGKNTEEPP